MLTVNLICVGNLKEKFSVDACKEYEKRLSAYCKLNVVEIKEQNQLANDIVILEKEGKEILSKLDGYSVLLDKDGEELSSEGLSKFVADISQKTSKINFVIGSSCGVSDEVRQKCNKKISFSKMTFPHNLFRVMFLEQLYRAFTIIQGKTYHK